MPSLLPLLPPHPHKHPPYRLIVVGVVVVAIDMARGKGLLSEHEAVVVEGEGMEVVVAVVGAQEGGLEMTVHHHHQEEEEMVVVVVAVVRIGC